MFSIFDIKLNYLYSSAIIIKGYLYHSVNFYILSSDMFCLPKNHVFFTEK